MVGECSAQVSSAGRASADAWEYAVAGVVGTVVAEERVVAAGHYVAAEAKTAAEAAEMVAELVDIVVEAA